MAHSLLSTAYVYLELGKLKTARTTFIEYVKKFPKHKLTEKALSDAILIDIKTEEWKDAINDSQQFLSMFPDSPQAARVHYRLATVFSESKAYQEAHQIYEEHLLKYEGVERHPDIYFFMGYNQQLLGNYQKAAEYYEMLQKDLVKPDIAYAAFKNAAYCFVRLEDYDKAAGYYQTIISDFAENDLSSDVLFWLADYYRQKRNAKSLKEVLNSFERKLGVEDDQGQLNYYKAEYHLILEDFTNAIIFYDFVLNKEELFVVEAFYGKGMALLSLDNYPAAIASFEQVVNNAGDNHSLAIEARTKMGEAHTLAGSPIEAAKAFFAIAILYDDPEVVPKALIRAGDAFGRAGKSKEAYNAYQELINRFPNAPLSEEARSKIKPLAA